MPLGLALLRPFSNDFPIDFLFPVLHFFYFVLFEFVFHDASNSAFSVRKVKVEVASGGTVLAKTTTAHTDRKEATNTPQWNGTTYFLAYK